MTLTVYFSFFLRNYLRSHRYLSEIILIFVMVIFFWGFLYTSKPEDVVWTVFAVLALVLNMVTVPSVYYLEKGNSLYFVLSHSRGRIHFLTGKLLLIWIIDFFWITLFAVIYGIRFLDGHYFAVLPLRLFFMGILMLLAILIFSLFYTYKPWIAWILFLLTIFGGIINKSALYPIESLSHIYAVFLVLLPPYLELIYSAVTLQFPFWRTMFVLLAAIQIVFYFTLNYRLILRRDFI